MISFLNAFMSYLLLAIIIVIVAGVALTIGITMAKKKSAGEIAAAAVDSDNGGR